MHVPLHCARGYSVYDTPITAHYKLMLWQYALTVAEKTGKGFRCAPGHGSKRRRPHNVKRNGEKIIWPIGMYIDGLMFIVRHGRGDTNASV